MCIKSLCFLSIMIGAENKEIRHCHCPQRVVCLVGDANEFSGDFDTKACPAQIRSPVQQLWDGIPEEVMAPLRHLLMHSQLLSDYHVQALCKVNR